MSPILGIYASQTTGHISTSSYESIATVTVGSGGSSSISFTSIPSTYKHLQIRYSASDSRTGTPWSDTYIVFNSDSSTNYSNHLLYTDSTTVSPGAASNQSFIQAASIGDASPSSVFGVGIIDILDYANTNKYKTIREISGNDENGTGFLNLGSGSWRSTTAINSITFTSITPNFRQYSIFALYGIKGA